jgi:dTDP-4-dehydrorhamnose 3,5-epimerase/CDP-3, 6-dideoxy-D-glycero-D-glycero-4-hexulose-5-epimerase
MKIIDEPLPGVRLLEPFVHRDPRGEFVKTFREDQLADVGIQMTIREEFFSTSAKNVLRGMHFQLPPHAHQKLVYCSRGRILDVILDLRRKSDTYGRAAGVELSEENRLMLHIPVGFAHGFLSLTDGACVIYKTDSVHAPSHDAGIFWNSFGFQWPLERDTAPVLSDRDARHPAFGQFASPF